MAVKFIHTNLERVRNSSRSTTVGETVLVSMAVMTSSMALTWSLASPRRSVATTLRRSSRNSGKTARAWVP